MTNTLSTLKNFFKRGSRIDCTVVILARLNSIVLGEFNLGEVASAQHDTKVSEDKRENAEPSSVQENKQTDRNVWNNAPNKR
jgi:hypothetical protein